MEPKVKSKLKTNSKEVRNKIKQHILDCVFSENEEYYGDIHQACNRLYSEFIRVANYSSNIKRIPNDQLRFSDYLFGLPFHFEYENTEVEKFLNSLGINPEGVKYSPARMFQLYHYLIYSEMMNNKTI